MKLSEFAQVTIDEILALSDDKKTMDYAVWVESQLSFKNLVKILQDLTQSEEELTLLHHSLLADFLQTRWQQIKNTDASYCHNPATLANRSCLLLAKRLFEQEQHILGAQNLSFYHLLMPHLKLINFKLSRSSLGDFELKEFILSDDGTPIEIQRCLDAAADKKQLVLCHSSHPDKALNEDECRRVIHHSLETESYYDAIIFFLKTGHQNDMNAASQNLQRALQENTYRIYASFGAKGRQKLNQTVVSLLNQLPNLLNLLCHLPRPQWQTLIKTIDSQKLFNLILGKQLFIDAVQKQDFAIEDDTQIRANYFLLLEVYMRQRAQGKKFINSIGFFTEKSEKYLGRFSHYIRSYSREDKIEAALMLQEFLISQKQLTELENHFMSDKMKQYWGPLKEQFSELHFVTQQLKKLAKTNLANNVAKIN